MYGLVNQAVKDFVVTNQGDEVWRQIAAEAGIDDADFTVMQAYPDKLTYDLVAAAHKVLGLEVETVLEVFGEYWPDFAKRTAYSRLMSFAGQSFEEFLGNLDQMHARIQMSLSDLDPPSFEVTDSGDGGFRLHYYSQRAGLAPMVKGLLKGLAKQFEVTIEVEQIESVAAGHDHDTFAIRYVDASSEQTAA